MKKLVLFGNGTAAAMLYHDLTRETDYRIVAFAVEREFLGERTLHGLPVVAWEEAAHRYPAVDHDMMIAGEFARGHRSRFERYARATASGYRLPSYVSAQACVWDGFAVGEGCYIAAHARIGPFVTVGDNVWVGSGSSIGHHGVIGSHCLLESSVHIAGHVTVGPSCYIGVNATIRNRLRLAPGCVIGAGAVILGDTVEQGVYLARPAHRLPSGSNSVSPA